VALFGRMVADIPGLNVEAATQVAHALSTHAVEVEFDYFTAVDDENPKEDTGAGMIGTVEFNSATLYRFATVGLHQLAANVGGDVEAALSALQAFVRAFVMSMPTGHENSFAHRTPPALVTVAVREDQPVNLVSAFEDAVRPNGHGIAAQSVTRLASELRRCGEVWGLTPLRVASAYMPGLIKDDEALDSGLGASLGLDGVISSVTATARQRLEGGEA
jgi:CRISPR system Cascade subunit CasC